MILVTGGTGYVGRFLMRRLVGLGQPCRCLVRPTSDCAELERLGVELWIGDLERPATARPAFVGARRILHLAHIRYAGPVVECADPDVERIVMVSSLRRFSQVPSTSVDEVAQGEARALQAHLPCVILRPSMVYGPGDDRNLSRLAAFLQRCRWVPVFGKGRGLQQPVYVEDLVSAILAAAERPAALGQCYAVAGPEALSYDELIDRVGAAVGVRPIKVHLPLSLILAGMRLLAGLGLRLGIEREQILRLQEDKAVSIEAARADLGYQPLALAEGLARIYGRRKGDG